MNFFLSVALALTCPNGTDSNGACILGESLEGGARDLIDILDGITNWLFTILLVLAVAFIILAAYKYLVSGGGEDVSKAHKMLVFAAVAVAVAVLAKGVVNVTKVLVGGGSGGSSSVSQEPPDDNQNFTEIPNTPVIPTAQPPHPDDAVWHVVSQATTFDGEPATVEIEICPDGQFPGIQIDGGQFEHNINLDNGYFLTPSGGVKVQKCGNGRIPHVRINGQTL